MFVTKLVAKLCTEDKNIRLKIRLLIDNAKYHTNRKLVERLQDQGINMHFLGPYSW